MKKTTIKLPLGKNRNKCLEAAADHQPGARVTLVYNPVKEGRNVGIVLQQAN